MKGGTRALKQIGLSVYPAHAGLDRNLAYLDLAEKYQFKRVFTCLLSVQGDREQILEEFRKTIFHANRRGMKVIADINPEVFRYLNVDYSDLRVFRDMGLYGIRLDNGFSGLEESAMSYNPYGLKIELNMSAGTRYIDNIFSYRPNAENLLGCHNFYPHRYSGLSYAHFMECSRHFKEFGLHTAAFVSAPAAEFGPWPVSEGLCTLEEHRDLPIEVQAKHLFSTGLIDDVLIANAFASEAELKALSAVDPDVLTLKAHLTEGISDLEREIVLNRPHFNRGDVSDYLVRSSKSRAEYRGQGFEPFHTVDVRRGDITIDNRLYQHYTGELQIALRDRKNDGNTNVVGRIEEDEIFLIDTIRPWQRFAFTE